MFTRIGDSSRTRRRRLKWALNLEQRYASTRFVDIPFIGLPWQNIDEIYPQNKFFKSLSSHLRTLRRTETEKRIKLYGTDMMADDYSDDDDGDVEYKTRTAKRRRL